MDETISSKKAVMQKKSLAEMEKAVKAAKFSLPYNIKGHKQLLSDGRWCHVFRHDELGELGRIIIVPRGTESQINCEVAGDPDDPMTTKRRANFEPIAKRILEIMSLSGGDGHGSPKEYTAPKEKHLVKSVVYPCDSCKEITAMIVFAEEAENTSQLADSARLMHAKIKELNVPTWIVGKESENIVNGEDIRKSLVLKEHPKREEALIMTPDDLMDTIDKLMEIHCKSKVNKTEKHKHTSPSNQLKQYDYIRSVLDRIRIKSLLQSMSNQCKEAVQRSAQRLEISEEGSLLLNTEHELNFFYEYCFYHYRKNGLNTMEIAYNKTHDKYEGKELEIFERAKLASFKFLKLIDPIKESRVLAYDEVAKKNYKVLDKQLHKSFSKNLKSGSRYYLLSYMIEFEDFIITTGASVIVNVNELPGKLLYERFEQYLRLTSYVEPNLGDTLQYITDMHKIALHEDIVGETLSNILPFGKEALEARVMKNITPH